MNGFYIPCDCSDEVLGIEYDEESKCFYLGIYEFKRKYSIRDKLRGIWRILRTGEPYGDQMVISKENMESIKSYLDECK
jgi:hypothetical protein